MRGSRSEGKIQENWIDARPPRHWERKNRTYNNNINYNEKPKEASQTQKKKIISQQNRTTKKQQKKQLTQSPLSIPKKLVFPPFVIAGFDRGCFSLLRRFLAL